MYYTLKVKKKTLIKVFGAYTKHFSLRQAAQGQGQFHDSDMDSRAQICLRTLAIRSNTPGEKHAHTIKLFHQMQSGPGKSHRPADPRQLPLLQE